MAMPPPVVQVTATLLIDQRNQEQKMKQRIVGAVLSLTNMAVAAQGQSNLTAKVNSAGATNPSPLVETDRVRDGLAGPVRRVRTEIAKLSLAADKTEEGKRVLLETAEYDVNGA